MAQDTALLRYLLKGARRAPGSGSQRDLAFEFDGTNDYISSNTTIGRTGYDLNVAGNVSTGSDGDGSYIQFNGNRDTAGLGTRADITGGTTPTFTQATDFTIKVRAKIIAVPATDTGGLFGSRFAFNISCYNATNLRFTVRGSSTVDYNSTAAFTLNTMFDAYLVFIANDAKFYVYVDGALKNVGGTAGPATFTSSTFVVGDNAIGGGNPVSSNKYIYHAAIRNKALTQAEVDADIALGNTAKNDPSIVAYYIPDNLTYNTQYLANPKDLSNATRTKGTGTTITADTTVAPDGTTTADTAARTGVDTATSKVMATSSPAISGSTLASKTFIVKAFVKVAAGTATFRQWIAHGTVADYRSSDQTATTTRQEFTFTQALTSSTSGTSLSGGICCSSTNLAATLQVRNVRCYLTNETLRDESPNIGGFLGWKQNEVISTRIKPTADAVGSTGDTQCFSITPYLYGHLRTTTNNIQIRADTRLAAIGAAYTLGNGFRDKAHIIGVRMRDGTKFLNKLYLNGALVSTVNGTEQAPISSGNYGTSFWMGRKGSSYFSGNIRDARIYTFTGSFVAADALAIYNGGEPTSSGITKYLHYRPPVGEVGTTTQDQSTNDRDGTLNGGVTRDYI